MDKETLQALLENNELMEMLRSALVIPTEPQTEPPTEPPTEPQTETQTEPPTEPQKYKEKLQGNLQEPNKSTVAEEAKKYVENFLKK